MEHEKHTHAHSHEHAAEEFEVHPCDGPGHQHHHHEDGSCCCEQHAREFHGIDKPMLIRLILAALCYLVAMIAPVGETVEMVLMILCAVIAGYDVLFSAVKNLLRGKLFDEYFLMTFAAIAAFLIGEYEEAAAVFLLYRIGAFCQSYAIRHSRRTIMHLTGDEELLDEDGRVTNRFISRFAKIYTPIILVIAVVIAVFQLFQKVSLHDAVYRALPFLVLACPCAIVISVPLAYFAGIGAAAKKRIFFHDSGAVDTVAAKNAALPQPKSTNVDGHTAFVYTLTNHTGEQSRLVLEEEESLPLARKIAVKTRRVALENVWFSIAVKVIVLILSAFGISALWLAVFADSGVTVLVVLNALRAFYVEK